MGGEYYNNPGGGASYLCLPHNPKYDKYKDRHQAVGYVYGTEYKVNDYNGDRASSSSETVRRLLRQVTWFNADDAC